MTQTHPNAPSIDATFNGPPDSAHGGYACATFAGGAGLPPPVAVTLLEPPPLASPFVFERGARRCIVRAGDRMIATVASVPATTAAVPPVDPATAEAAAEHFSDAGHPFPTCFVCGHGRPDGSGLRLRPGSVPGRADTVACPWKPDVAVGECVPDELLWSVLDCPGGWVCDPAVAPAVLTRMAAEITSPVRAGRSHVVVAALVRRTGRTRTVLTALYTDTSHLVAKATATWTELASTLPTTGN